MNQRTKLFLRKHAFLYNLVAKIYDLRPLERKYRSAIRASLLAFGPNSLRFVQIGANDAGINNPFSRHITRYRASAILIEPVPHIFARLKKKFYDQQNVTTINCAITPSNSEPLKFYWVDPAAKRELGSALPPWWDQLGSFNRANITSHLDGILEPYIRVSKVPTQSISAFLNQHSDTNYLALDCEGYDYEILKSYDFRVKPRFLVFEFKHMSIKQRLDLEAHLKAYGYTIKFYRNDAIAELPV